MIEILPKERWPELAETLAENFDAVLPNASQSMIVADVEPNGTIKSFVILEMLVRIGQVWSKGNANPRPMFRYIEQSLSDTSVIGIASEPRFEGLCTKYGMREVPGKVYRRDF